MDLTHFTDARYLPYILGSGVIIPTESNIGAQGEASRQGWNPSGAHFGPDVVWLTTGDAISSGITVGPDKKGSGKVTVRVPDEDAVHWPIWARQQGIDERWYQATTPKHGGLLSVRSPPRSGLQSSSLTRSRIPKEMKYAPVAREKNSRYATLESSGSKNKYGNLAIQFSWFTPKMTSDLGC